jgi:hypothetical protein
VLIILIGEAGAPQFKLTLRSNKKAQSGLEKGKCSFLITSITAACQMSSPSSAELPGEKMLQHRNHISVIGCVIFIISMRDELTSHKS